MLKSPATSQGRPEALRRATTRRPDAAGLPGGRRRPGAGRPSGACCRRTVPGGPGGQHRDEAEVVRGQVEAELPAQRGAGGELLADGLRLVDQDAGPRYLPFTRVKMM